MECEGARLAMNIVVVARQTQNGKGCCFILRKHVHDYLCLQCTTTARLHLQKKMEDSSFVARCVEWDVTTTLELDLDFCTEYVMSSYSDEIDYEAK